MTPWAWRCPRPGSACRANPGGEAQEWQGPRSAAAVTAVWATRWRLSPPQLGVAVVTAHVCRTGGGHFLPTPGCPGSQTRSSTRNALLETDAHAADEERRVCGPRPFAEAGSPWALAGLRPRGALRAPEASGTGLGEVRAPCSSGAARRTRNAESGRPSRADGRGDAAHARAGTPLRLRGKDAPPPATMRMELWGHRQRDQSRKDTPRRGRWQEAAQSPGLGSRGCRQGGRGGAERVVGTELGLWREEVLDTVPATVRGVRRYLSPPSSHPNLGKPIHCAVRVSPQGDLSV